MGAAPNTMPGWPEFALVIASADKTLIVFTARRSLGETFPNILQLTSGLNPTAAHSRKESDKTLL